MEYYKKSKKIIQIEKSKSYLTREDKERRVKVNEKFDEMNISESEFYGQRLLISNKYSWIVCVYARDFFVDLCNSLNMKLK